MLLALSLAKVSIFRVSFHNFVYLFFDTITAKNYIYSSKPII